jgi:acetolactate decarboxylase
MMRKAPVRFRIIRHVVAATFVLYFGVWSLAFAQHAPTASATYPFSFKSYGTFRDMVMMRAYGPVVQLDEVVKGGATDAVGAVSGLRGEITILNGQLVVSHGAPCGKHCPAAIQDSATLLATAVVRQWVEVPIDRDLDGPSLEGFVRAAAKEKGLDEGAPFPFRIRGTLTDFLMHVNAAPNPQATSGSHTDMALTTIAKGPRLAGEIVGFYAPPSLEGVITHRGQSFHAHYIDAAKQTTAHLDAFGMAAGSVLMLPLVGQKNGFQH